MVLALSWMSGISHCTSRPSPPEVWSRGTRLPPVKYICFRVEFTVGANAKVKWLALSHACTPYVSGPSKELPRTLAPLL